MGVSQGGLRSMPGRPTHAPASGVYSRLDMRAGLDSHEQRLRLGDLGISASSRSPRGGYQHRARVSRAGGRSVSLAKTAQLAGRGYARLGPSRWHRRSKASSRRRRCSGRTSGGCDREDDARTRDRAGIRLTCLRQASSIQFKAFWRFRRLCLEPGAAPRRTSC